MKNIFNVKKDLRFLTISVYITTILSFFVINFDWNLFALTIFLYFLIFGFGISLTFHRSITHAALTLNPILEFIGKFFASLGGTGSPIGWSLIHLQHHRYSDIAGDPHHPTDLRKYFFGEYAEVSKKGLKKLMSNKINRIIHRYYYLLLISYGVLWAFVGFDYFIYGFIYPMFLTILAGHIVNWYTHSDHILNYRTHETRDNSQNNIIVGLITWGEGFHNTHHRYPRRANFSQAWWEIDTTFLICKVLQFVKLAKVS